MAQDAQHRRGPGIGRTAAGLRALALAGMLALAACSHRAATQSAEAPVIAEPVQMQPVAAPRPTTPKDRPTPRRKRPAQPTQERERSVRPIEPEEVTGLTEGEIGDLLGAPTWREEKSPARMWGYSGGSCEVKVTFYPELGDLTYRALDVEVTGLSGDGPADAACLGELAAGRRRKA